MNKFVNVALVALLAGGCASQGARGLQETEDANQKLLRENEYRLNTLENSITALNTQIAQLNNRVYEVRTRNGQRTSMTVVPIVPPEKSATAPTGQPVPKPVASAPKPQGRVINPTAKPAAIPAVARPAPAARPPVQRTPVAASASGSIGAPASPPADQLTAQNDDLALPPSELPPQLPDGDHVTSITAPANTGTVRQVTATGNPEVPVPAMPPTDLSLPPEHPGLPPAAAQAPAPPAPVPARTTATPQRGEEAAYKAALNAARSGHTDEGIRLFRDFLQKYPNGRYTANADYWIGECLYSQGKYQDALNQFQTVNNSFPKHHKNADALLKAGITMSRMGDKAGAQEKFKTLMQTFPNSDAAKRARSMGGAN